MKHIWKRGIATLLVGTMAIANTPATAFAADTATVKEITATTVTEAISNNNISVKTAHKIAEEIINSNYDYINLEQEERAVSSAIKTVLKFIKNNWSKVAAILKKYGVIIAQGKSVTEFVDQLLDGVIEVSDSIDAAIYTIVDFVAPDLNENVKQVITNAIRLICPV